MPTDKTSKRQIKHPDEAASQRDLPVKVEVEQIDKRVTNVEKVVETVEDLATSALELFGKYLENKDVSEQRQLQNEDRQHKRAVYLISYAIAIVFILCMTALFLNQVSLVQLFINSGLAIAAGTGLSSMLKSGGKTQSKSDKH